MADKTQRVPENALGAFYVDETCIDCEYCRETAPKHFRRCDPGRYSYLAVQPKTPEEEAACRTALEGCPVEAIGDDGKTVSEGKPRMH